MRKIEQLQKRLVETFRPLDDEGEKWDILDEVCDMLDDLDAKYNFSFEEKKRIEHLYLTKENLQKLADYFDIANLDEKVMVYPSEKTDVPKIPLKEIFSLDKDALTLLKIMDEVIPEFKDDEVHRILDEDGMDGRNKFADFISFRLGAYYYEEMLHLKDVSDNFLYIGKSNAYCWSVDNYLRFYIDPEDFKQKRIVLKNKYGVELGKEFMKSYALTLNSPWADDTQHYLIKYDTLAKQVGGSETTYSCEHSILAYEGIDSSCIGYGKNEKEALMNCIELFEAIQEMYNKEGACF